jgi:hypothetical protein
MLTEHPTAVALLAHSAALHRQQVVIFQGSAKISVSRILARLEAR